MHPGEDDLHPVGAAARLDALVDPAGIGVPVVAVVEGPAGVGRTVLLRRLLRRHDALPATAVGGLPWAATGSGAPAGRLLAPGVGPIDLARCLRSATGEPGAPTRGTGP